MASFTDLDGLALTLIAQQLPLASATALATTCRYFHGVLAAKENVAFWKKVAGEVWGVVGVDSPGAVPRLPGGSGAGEEASSWKQSCTELLASQRLTISTIQLSVEQQRQARRGGQQPQPHRLQRRPARSKQPAK